ncbi:MAG: hypothetical protein NTW07_05830 [candidate division Zixibacteria bacterium]|nr:hypothetical protein [candidate division Zixibacteria bacterium]
MKKIVRCTYVKNCYLAEALECYGFKTDCPLYLQSNDEPCNDARFHAAMDQLINRTRERHDRGRGEPLRAESPIRPPTKAATGS